ncbi:hypothetical protein EV126DRAFT_427521 [Verticillium dahliae]|nr:hypothetical protein EV126DRAFT_427521 [Verticillium dahliae]
MRFAVAVHLVGYIVLKIRQLLSISLVPYEYLLRGAPAFDITLFSISMAQPECTLSPPASIHEDQARGQLDILALECTLSPPPSLHNVPIDTPKGKSTAKPTVTFDLTPPDPAGLKSQQPTRVQPPNSWPEKVVPEAHPQPQGGSNPSGSKARPDSISESINSTKLPTRKSFDKSAAYVNKQAQDIKAKLNSNERKPVPQPNPAPAPAEKPSENPVRSRKPADTNQVSPPVADDSPKLPDRPQPPLKQRIRDAHNQRKERRADMSPSGKLKDITENMLIGCGIGAIVLLICGPCGIF